MVSAVITAAGKNRRMIDDLKSKKMEPIHKLLMDLNGQPVIINTIDNVLKSGVDQCTVVLGHFSSDIVDVLENYRDKRLMVIENPDSNVELSETLLNGVKNYNSDLILCVAGDQPTVTVKTYKNLIEKAVQYENPENIVSILARKNVGYLKSAEGLGMPFVCHSNLLKRYLRSYKDNLNPILRKMIADGVIFFGIAPVNELELVNINRYQDYVDIRNNL